MSQLEDDIARIAALRGKTAADYVDPATGNYRTFKSTTVSPQLVAAIFMASPDAQADLRAYDRLSPTARRFVRSHPIPLNAMVYASALDGIEEEALELIIQAHLPGQVATWIRRHYGAGHPSLRKLT